MNNKQININEISVAELKALAYDQIVEIQRLQINLTLLQEEIKKRENLGEIKEDKDGITVK